MRRWSRSASRREASRVRTFHALGREILRDAGAAVEPLADRDAVLRRVAPGCRRRRTDAARHRDLAAEAGAGRNGRRGRGGPGRRAHGSSVRRIRARRRRDRRPRLRRPRPAGDRRAVDRRVAPRALARALPRAARRRGPGRRPGAAPARPAARGARQPDLPRRRRRPERSTAGGSPTSAACSVSPPSCPACDASTSRSTIAVRRRSSSARSGSSSTTASGSRSGSGPGRGNGQPGARAGWQRRDGPPPSACCESWPDDGSTRAVLARTNRELLPAVAVALELGWPFRAPRIELPVESPLVDEALEQLAARAHRPGTAAGHARPAPDRGA